MHDCTETSKFTVFFLNEHNFHKERMKFSVKKSRVWSEPTEFPIQKYEQKEAVAVYAK